MRRLALIALALSILNARAESQHQLHVFDRVQLTGTYFSEGVNTGDLNNDGKTDVVYGPYWFAGPDLTTRHEIYPPVPQNTNSYADQFFCWVRDFNDDGWQDVLTVGFPGTPAYVYENPGKTGHGRHWAKHEVFDWVSNEAPQFTNLVGDESPELVCTRDGFFGYAAPVTGRPLAPWKFHRVSRQVADKRFGHGLGIGDVNSDGRNDILAGNGWYEQPASLDGGPPWQFHPFEFAPAAADMFAYDVDGDGDNDVVTSLDAHAYGLAWYEQIPDGDAITFRQHIIMGKLPTDNQFGVMFTEPHSLNLVDIDGDGLKDIATGKTYYSHHQQSPHWDAGAVVYWFQLQRDDKGVHWVPHRADDSAGIGRQLIVRDIDGDGHPELITGGMKGCHVLRHKATEVDEETWLAAQPRQVKPMASGLTPIKAAEQMTVPAGFRVQLAAGEPLVHQPIAMTFDARGRLWVAEAYTYPQRAAEGQGRDRIIILEDSDLDGTLDSRKVFAKGLNLVSGLEVGFGGVWVGAAPYLMFIPDANGDDIPDDQPQVLLDGFGYQDTHEVLNAFIWGPDGWLYGCHGVFTHSLVGQPGTPQDERTPMNAAVWRYHPTRHTFDVFMNGTSNPWGVDFNDHGHAFITACVIPHMFHVIQGARYQRQGGQHFNRFTYDDIKTIADHAHYAGNIRDSAWWGHEPTLTPTNSAAGGGHAHCGAMVYLGDNWPMPYRDSIYFHNVHGNRVNNDLLARSGSGYVASHGQDFLMANDHYFRGINLRSGPDGTVHVIDWYDKNACHQTRPEVWDRSNGRIYRVSYGSVAPLAINLDALSDIELARLQSHENEWHVRTARRLLQERAHRRSFAETSSNFDRPINSPNVRSVQEELLRQFRNAAGVPQKLRALWALHAVNAIDGDLMDEALRHSDENIRGWAIQLALEPNLSSLPIPAQASPADRLAASSRKTAESTVARTGSDTALGEPSDRSPPSPSEAVPRRPTPQTHKAFVQLARTDESQLVRLYLASALQRLPPDLRWPIAQNLLSHASDATDQNLPLMIWYGVEPLVSIDPGRAMKMAAASQIPTVTRFITRRAAADNDSLPHVIRGLTAADSSTRRLILAEIQNAFDGRVNIPMPSVWTAVYTELLRDPDPRVREQADHVALLLGDERILPRLRELVLNTDAATKKRLEALHALIRSRDPEAAPVYIAALTQPSIRGPAIRALASFDRADASDALLRLYGSFSASEQQDAINTLTARPSSAIALLDAIENAQIPRSDVHAYNIRQLRSFDDATLKTRLESVWGTIREMTADKKQRIADLKSQMKDTLADADLSNGRLLFSTTCASCHKLFGQGGEIGPDITGSNRADLDYILENIVDPSAVVSKDYTMSTIYTDDGRAVTGLVLSESDSAITVRTVNDTLLIPKNEIEERVLSKLSLMPDGQLDQLAPEDLRDLIGYLGSPSQVMLPKTPSPIDPKTGKVADAIEGESMRVVSKSAGDVRNQPMGEFNDDQWSGNDQLWWTGQTTGSQLVLEWTVPRTGVYRIDTALTCARDYGVVQLEIDGKPLGEPIDAFHADKVVTTGLVALGTVTLTAGKHNLRAIIVAKNPQSIGHMFGLDYIRLVDIDR